MSEREKQAEVAELADALRSGRSEGALVWVRLPPSALFYHKSRIRLVAQDAALSRR